MRYIAGRQQKVDGRYVGPGDPIKTAADWPNLDAYLADGTVIAVDDDAPPHQLEVEAKAIRKADRARARAEKAQAKRDEKQRARVEAERQRRAAATKKQRATKTRAKRSSRKAAARKTTTSTKTARTKRAARRPKGG